MTVTQLTDATRNRYDRDAALALARTAETVIVARGKKLVTFAMKVDPPDDDTLAEHLLGPTGNLKAPTLRQGTTLYVGFSEAAYQQLLTGKG